MRWRRECVKRHTRRRISKYIFASWMHHNQWLLIIFPIKSIKLAIWGKTSFSDTPICDISFKKHICNPSCGQLKRPYQIVNWTDCPAYRLLRWQPGFLLQLYLHLAPRNQDKCRTIVTIATIVTRVTIDLKCSWTDLDLKIATRGDGKCSRSRCNGCNRRKLSALGQQTFSSQAMSCMCLARQSRWTLITWRRLRKL
jgi:hypothetical protein